MIEQVVIDGRKATKADMPGGYIKLVFEDGEIAIARLAIATEPVKKFNPFHDEKGRFTTGGAATFISTGDKFTKTITRLREQMKAKEQANAKVEYESFNELTTKDDYQRTDGATMDYLGQLNKETQAQYDSLTPAEKRSIYKYTYNGSGSINYAVGEGNIPSQDNYWDPELTNHEVVDAINSGIAKGSLTRDHLLYAAINLRNIVPAEHREASLRTGAGSTVGELRTLTGMTLTAKAFTSTTMNPFTARGFQASHRVIMEIEAPKGTKGLYLGDDIRKEGREDRSRHPAESEVLLPTNQRFVVTGAKTKYMKTPEGPEEFVLLTVRVI